MNHNRREFIKTMGLGTAGLFALSSFDITRLADQVDLIRLTIVHTNDMHSQIEAFPIGHKKYSGMGGMAKRASIIQSIREESAHMLLFDSGDIFQGTPYFNFFGGEVELKLMSEMGYDCATMGNHDFDNGLIGFEKMLPHANFPFVTSNYDFSDTILDGKTYPYRIFKKGPLKIGVFGIGIKLQGLVNKDLYGDTVHLDEILTANTTAKILVDRGCDFVICLSHLGYRYDDNKISDLELAKKTCNIDLILGGHTHTFLEQPTSIQNSENQAILVNQAGWAGLAIGKLDFFFEKSSKRKWDNNTALFTNKNCAKKII
ncbi:MAG: metallophosphatase [Flavobacteriales bacterium]|jgi:5'-nucleotidase|nr:bifunctional metallophosphatase/5'-nucleotidase [Crocinitomicaceae bacterium]MDG2331956.1 metallophosphatase [Flavobacteriales bacterium]